MDLNSSPTTSSTSSPEKVQPQPTQTQPVQQEPMQNSTPVQQQEMLDIGQARDFHLMELQHIQSMVAHKQNELNVYIAAEKLIQTREAGERCLVFLADNLFVMRTREQAMEILQRQVQVHQNALKLLVEEQKALEQRVKLMEQLNITAEGLVEIREAVDEGPEKQELPKRRVAHQPAAEPEILGKANKTMDDAEKHAQPKALKDNKALSKWLAEQAAAKRDEWEERQLALARAKQGDRHVHFPEWSDNGAVPHYWAQNVNRMSHSKREQSILKNRNEQSPVDMDELKKMNERDFKPIVSTSEETLGDEIVERNLNRLVPVSDMFDRMEVKERKVVPKNQQPKSAQNRRRGNGNGKNRPVSHWKAQRQHKSSRMGLPSGSDED